MPKPSTPALLEMQVSPYTPFSTSAAMQFSGMPQRPNPPNANTAPSGISRTASAAFFTILFMLLSIPANGRLGTRKGALCLDALLEGEQLGFPVEPLRIAP